MSAGSWTDVPMAPLDPILGMSQRFQADTDDRKVNVSIGAYRTDEGKPLVLNCVKKAEKLILDDASLNKEYLPQRGDVTYSALCQQMLFGEGSQLLKDGVVATAQTLSGTGALRLGAEFVKRYAPESSVYISSPTWGPITLSWTKQASPTSPTGTGTRKDATSTSRACSPISRALPKDRSSCCTPLDTTLQELTRPLSSGTRSKQCAPRGTTCAGLTLRTKASPLAASRRMHTPCDHSQMPGSLCSCRNRSRRTLGCTEREWVPSRSPAGPRMR